MKGRVRRGVLFISKKKIMPIIINTPLDTKTGRPIMGKSEVELYGKVFKGYHAYSKVLLKNKKGLLYQRVVIG